MTLAYRKCHNMYEIVYLLFSYFNACKVGLINLINFSVYSPSFFNEEIYSMSKCKVIYILI
jgi:hypothetical protein